MNGLLSPETFEFFARYLLAGLVFLAARSWVVAGERLKPNETIIEGVILSLINQMVWLAAFGWFEWGSQSPLPQPALVLQVVVQPAILGWAFGRLLTAGLAPLGLRRLIMPVSRPVSDAFDLAVERIPGSAFIIVTYEDGTIVCGLFSQDSHASFDQNVGGIYIESLCTREADESWTESDPPRSAWISMTGVRSVEFLPVGED